MRELNEEDKARLDALCRKHYEAVFRVCMRYANGNRDWALDRTHDVFFKLAERLDTLADHDDLGGWMYRVGVNTCLMEIRRETGWRRRISQVKHFFEGTAPSPERAVLAKRDLGVFEEAVSRLPEKTRALVVMVYVDGKSQNEAADILGISKGYASKLLAKALDQLRSEDWEVSDD